MADDDEASMLNQLKLEGSDEKEKERELEGERETERELTSRQKRLLQVASQRIRGVCIVLENITNYGNRAAILRSVEALGFLYVDEIIPPLETTTPPPTLPTLTTTTTTTTIQLSQAMS